jgi:small-conductance mechanosensitive channel
VSSLVDSIFELQWERERQNAKRMFSAVNDPPVIFVVIAVVAGIAFLVGLVVMALWLFRAYERSAKRALEAKYAGLEVRDDPRPGDVTVVYHTYHGFLVWFTQVAHRASLPPDDARRLLGRLLRFNLCWGLVTYGAVFAVPLAVANYVAQRRSIAAQEEAARWAAEYSSALAGVPPPADDNPYASPSAPADVTQQSSSFVRVVVAWICLAMAILCAISTVVSIVTRKYDAALGGVFMLALFAWIAYDWLRHHDRFD